jgi:Xaa-Pro aminopeptidase
MAASLSEARVKRLAARLRDAGFDAYFAASPISMGYLTGFFEGGGERFLVLAVRSTGEMRMICPSLSQAQAQRCGISDVRAWRDGEDPLQHFSELGRDWNLRAARIAVDDDMPAAMLLAMQGALPAALFAAGQPILGGIMRRKDAQELELLRAAARIADAAYERILPQIRVGMKESELEGLIMSEMQRLGGKPTFCIVATGANSAEPHHLSDDTVLREGDVVILDFGCSVGGYQSDITRTVALGRPDPEAERVYEIVYAAHMAGRAAAGPGVAAQEVDRAARKVIQDAGYGEYFMHRTGHGIGLRGHEEPFIVEGNDRPLEPGDCFSVEPGIYLAGRFGVRIENIVTMTDTGSETLNAEPEGHLRTL